MNAAAAVLKAIRVFESCTTKAQFFVALRYANLATRHYSPNGIMPAQLEVAKIRTKCRFRL